MKKIWKEFLSIENIFLFLSVVLCIAALIPEVFGERIISIDSAILLVLGGLAVAQLANNYNSIKKVRPQMESIKKTQNDIETVLKKFPLGMLHQRKDLVFLDAYIKDAKKVCIIGRTLSKFTAQVNALNRLLEDGCNINLVLMDTRACEKNDLEIVIPEPNTKEAKELFKTELLFSMGNIRTLNKITSNTEGKIKVKVTNYVSNISYMAVEMKDGIKKILVEFMPYQCEELMRPNIEVISSDPDPYFYKFFSEIIEKIWQNAKSLSPQELSTEN
ncbi:MAG: hypothetical protein ACOY90_17700 [Candidatus Zhuqueibacterota bacterium]